MRTKTPEESDVIIQKIPCDIGIHRNARKGTLNAPEKIMERFNTNKNIFVDEVFTDEFDLENTQRRIERNTENLLEYGKPIISVGGDHSISFPLINLLKRQDPDMKLVWVDAHLDLKEKVNNHVSHDVVVRELVNRGFSPEEIYFVGITRKDSDEENFLKDRSFHIYGSSEINEFLEEFENNNSVYLSMDIDVLKPELAPGTGYTDGDLEFEDLKQVIKTVNPDNADLVEVAPSLDQENKTVNIGEKLLGELVSNLS